MLSTDFLVNADGFLRKGFCDFILNIFFSHFVFIATNESLTKDFLLFSLSTFSATTEYIDVKQIYQFLKF